MPNADPPVGSPVTTVERPRLLQQLDLLHQPLRAFLAPPGWGKSIAASQMLASAPHGVWVRCDGETLQLDRVLSAMGEHADGGGRSELAARLSTWMKEAGGAPGLVVLDDVCIKTSQHLDELWQFAQLAAQHGVGTVVTSRAQRLPEHPSAHRIPVVGARDLRFTKAEADALARSIGRAAIDDVEVAAALDACAGQAAILAMMLRLCGAGTPLSAIESAQPFDVLIELVESRYLDASSRGLLAVIAAIGDGTLRTLKDVGMPVQEANLEALQEAIPLLGLRTGGTSWGTRFTVHQLLRKDMDRRFAQDNSRIPAQQLRRIIDALEARRDTRRVAELLLLVDEPEGLREFCVSYGHELILAQAPHLVVSLIERVPLSEVMGDATLLMLWSDAFLEIDQLQESLAKARAARLLAEHNGARDTALRAAANCADVLRITNRWDEAREVVAAFPSPWDVDYLEAGSAAALVSGAKLLIVLGEWDDAEAFLSSISYAARSFPDAAEWTHAEAQSLALRAILPSLSSGAFSDSVVSLSDVSEDRRLPLTQLVAAKGNLSVALVETGRIDRVLGLIDSVVGSGVSSSLAYFLPVLGCAQFADGQESVGLDSISRGIATALELGAEAEAAQNRVYEAMLLRAAGRFEESLTSAERAYERLCLQDFMDFRRLAVLEVAASLLALGDTSAARAWAEPVINSGFGRNLHHEFRAAMIIAECERREGDRQAGVERLAAYADHVRSENSNFQLGMYSRAFPDLLGMVAHTVGVESLPVHLVRLITPEAAERCLRSSKDLLDPAEWAELGVRLLGAEQFAGFIERKGRPLCRVRMFGGLDITVGDRAIRERDWKKRKARQLFTMLALKRGQEVPRDVILDHLWPDLTEEKAKNNFYVAWSTMKSTLMGDEAGQGPCPYVDNAASRCRVLRDAVRSDIDEFEELIAAARNAESVGDPDGAVAAFERLASVYHGDLLPSDLYDDWFTAARERYRFEFIAAMTRMVELLLERDSPCEALVYARRALQVDPYREDLYQAALRCHIAAGQRSAAIETFVACKTQLSEELGLDPSSETVSLYEQILVMEERPRYDDFGLTVRRTDG